MRFKLKYIPLLCAVINFLSEVNVADAKGEYAIVAPRWIRPHHNFEVCVILMKNSGPDVHVKIILNGTTKGKVEYEKKETFKPGTENVMTLEIKELKEYSYALTAEGCGGITFKTDEGRVSRVTNNVIILIQTDKAIYKQGQKVLFKVMALNVDLKPYTGTFIVTIRDKSSNKLRETKERNTKRRDCEFIYSDEFQLADEPPLGRWSIRVETETGEAKTSYFTVEEYVLPKVEVKVLLGSFYHRSMDSIVATIQAKYTYGQPVKGTAKVEIYFQQYRPQSSFYNKIVEVVELQNGEANVTLTRSKIISLFKCTYCKGGDIEILANYPYRSSYIVFNATVTEKITGDKYRGDNRIQGKYTLLSLTFMTSTPRNYKPGMVWTGFVKLTRADGSSLLEDDKRSVKGTPLKLEAEFLYKDGRYITQTKEKKYYDITDDGIIMVEFQSKRKHIYYVDVDVTYPHAGKAASGAEEVVSSQIVEKHITKNTQSIQVDMVDQNDVIQPSDKTVKFRVKTTEPISSFYYQIVSKRRIIKKAKVLASGKSNTFNVLFNKKLAHKASPSAKMVVWYISGKQFLIDSIQITVNGTFINDVSLTLSKGKVKPGEEVTVTAKSDPQSCVGLLARDKSVLLLKQGNDITRKSVTDQLYVLGANHRYIYRKKRSYRWWYPVYIWGSDPKEIIQNAGLVVLTDAYIHDEPQSICSPYRRYYPYYQYGPTTASTQLSKSYEDSRPLLQTPPKAETATDDIRDFFPETWIWMNLFTGKNGMVSTEVEAPDTITSFVFSAFSVNGNSGLGIMDETTELTVFKSCFTDLRLPFSAIRNEVLELRAVVFNYLNTSQRMTVTLMKSENNAFYAEGNSKEDPVKSQSIVKTVQIPANDGKEVNFYIKPVKLGELPVEVHIKSKDCSDALRKDLTVEAEGEPQDYSKGLFYGLNNETDSDTVNIQYPPDVVEGSQRIIVTAIGDVMGPSIENLEYLIRKPYGCAEQNMVTFAPNIYVLDYLRATQMSSPGKEKKIKGYMEIGYQRELTFQRSDGSFSAFGLNDKVGSLWMTSFVVRCFEQAKSYIGIDQRIIDRATNFIIKQQQDDGSFKEPTASRVTYSYLQGGVSKGVSMTAYVAKVLEEIIMNLNSVNKTAVRKAIRMAQSYLEENLDTVSGKPYSLSLTCYFLCNASSPRCNICLQYLEILAIRQGGKVHWENPDRSKRYKYWRPPYYWPQSNSVEMTAYVLLTYCMKGETDKAAPVARWLATVRTSYGGYRSTQDTVVGLQALATYFAKFPVSSKRGVDVKLRWKGGMHSFNTIQTKNYDIFQQFKIPSTSVSSIIVEAEGSGTAVVQVNVFFNKNSSAGESGFKLTVSSVVTASSVKLKICVIYNLEGSGMVIIEVKMLTAFYPDLAGLLSQHELLKRIEFKGNRLILYFDEITSIQVCITITLKPAGRIKNLKPAVITVYSYYESNIRDSVLYLPSGEVNS